MGLPEQGSGPLQPLLGRGGGLISKEPGTVASGEPPVDGSWMRAEAEGLEDFACERGELAVL